MKRRRRGGTQLATLWAQIAQRFSLSRSGVHLITLGLVVISLWLLASFVGQVIVGAQMDRRKDELRAEVAHIEAGNKQLATAVAYANSPAYAEQTARDQLGYAKEGEVVVLPNIVAPTPVAAQPTSNPAAQPTSEPNWRGWTQAFFPSSSR